jgi:hypothetical protein
VGHWITRTSYIKNNNNNNNFLKKKKKLFGPLLEKQSAKCCFRTRDDKTIIFSMQASDNIAGNYFKDKFVEPMANF